MRVLISTIACAIVLALSCGRQSDGDSTLNTFVSNDVHTLRNAAVFSIFDPQSPPNIRTRCWYYSSSWKILKSWDETLRQTQMHGAQPMLNNRAISDMEFLRMLNTDNPDFGDLAKIISDAYASHFQRVRWWEMDLHKSTVGYTGTLDKGTMDYMRDVLMQSNRVGKTSQNGMPCPRPDSARFQEIALQNMAYVRSIDPSVNFNQDSIANAILDNRSFDEFLDHQQRVQNEGDYGYGEATPPLTPTHPVDNQPYETHIGTGKSSTVIDSTRDYDYDYDYGYRRSGHTFTHLGNNLADLLARGVSLTELVPGRFEYLGYSPYLYTHSHGDEHFDYGSSLNSKEQPIKVLIDIHYVEGERAYITVRSHTLNGHSGFVHWEPENLYVSDRSAEVHHALEYDPYRYIHSDYYYRHADGHTASGEPHGPYLHLSVRITSGATSAGANLHSSYSGGMLSGEICNLSEGDAIYYLDGTLASESTNVYSLIVANAGTCGHLEGTRVYIYKPNFQ